MVVPTNRPEQFREFMDAWRDLFRKHGVYVHVCVDGPEYEPYRWSGAVEHSLYAWHNVPDFIPRRTDMIRSWGIYRAWAQGREFTLSLDDDVRPEGDIFEAFEAVFDAGAVCSDYLDVGALTSYPGQLRGFPFRDRVKSEVAIQYGGWNGVLDYDAPTQLSSSPGSHTFGDVVLPVPRGAAVTGCIMNCAWRTEYAPIMWQLPLDSEGRFNRFGDIWSGLFQKRVLDALGKVMVVNGRASVRHERASDPIANLERETPGIRLNEDLWSLLGAVGSSTLIGGFMTATNLFAAWIERSDRAYYDHFIKCRNEWVALFA